MSKQITVDASVIEKARELGEYLMQYGGEFAVERAKNLLEMLPQPKTRGLLPSTPPLPRPARKSERRARRSASGFQPMR